MKRQQKNITSFFNKKSATTEKRLSVTSSTEGYSIFWFIIEEREIFINISLFSCFIVVCLDENAPSDAVDDEMLASFTCSFPREEFQTEEVEAAPVLHIPGTKYIKAQIDSINCVLFAQISVMIPLSTVLKKDLHLEINHPIENQQTQRMKVSWWDLYQIWTKLNIFLFTELLYANVDYAGSPSTSSARRGKKQAEDKERQR